MLEQAVAKRDNASERKRKKIYRSIQIVILVLMILGEILGFALSGIFFETNRNAFWQWVLLMVVLALPVLLLAVLLEIPIRRNSTEYDYVLQGNCFSVYRIIYGRRKWYLSFDLRNVVFIRPFADVAEDQDMKGVLRKSVIACCNACDDELLCFYVSSCSIKRTSRRTIVILEPNAEFREVLHKELRSVMEA